MTMTWNLLQTKTVALSSRLQKGSTWFSLFYIVHEVLNYNVTFIDFCLQLRHFKDTLSVSLGRLIHLKILRKESVSGIDRFLLFFFFIFCSLIVGKLTCA